MSGPPDPRPASECRATHMTRREVSIQSTGDDEMDTILYVNALLGDWPPPDRARILSYLQSRWDDNGGAV